MLSPCLNTGWASIEEGLPGSGIDKMSTNAAQEFIMCQLAAVSSGNLAVICIVMPIITTSAHLVRHVSTSRGAWRGERKFPFTGLAAYNIQLYAWKVCWVNTRGKAREHERQKHQITLAQQITLALTNLKPEQPLLCASPSQKEPNSTCDFRAAACDLSNLGNRWRPTRHLQSRESQLRPSNDEDAW